MDKNKKIKLINLGLIDYKEAWDYQTSLFDEIIDKKIRNRKDGINEPTDNYLLVCQHPHVYTLGKSGKADHLLANKSLLEQLEASFYKINRGGDITYHGPGQVVAYPILDLDNFFTDIHKYMRYLEEAVIKTVEHYGIKGDRISGLTGVWLNTDTANPEKICAFGVKSSRWVTMHGLAFNVNPDLSYFNHIVPCGIQDKGVTSLKKELGKEVDIEEAENLIIKNLIELFEADLIVQNKDEEGHRVSGS